MDNEIRMVFRGRERIRGSFTAMLLAALIYTLLGFGSYVYAESGFAFEQDSYAFTVCEYEAEVCVNSNEGVEDWDSSNKSVATISYGGYNTAYLDVNGVGNTTITATGYNGSVAQCTVTVNESPWTLSKSSIEVSVSDDDVDLEIVGSGNNNEFDARSSNPNVVDVYTYTDYCSLMFEGVGTSTITVTDKYGKTRTCLVTVKPDPLKLNKSSLLYDSEDDYSEDEETLYAEGCFNDIKTVVSSNPKVVKVKRKSDYDSHAVEVTPIGVGTATITVTDQYGQTVKVPVTVTQKYIDESKYLDDLENSYVENVEYGDNAIYVHCYIESNIYTTINGKTYVSSVDEYGDYVIKGMPTLPVGSKIKVHIEKGQAKYTETITVEKKRGADLPIKIKAQNYTGKALKPAVTIKHGKNTLKNGTDYAVKYSNNKTIGKAKAAITFKGNYKGSKVVYFNIRPKGTAIKNVSAIKDGFKMKWKKRTTQVDGYQIQYSLYKEFYGSAIKTINSNRTTSTKITGLWNHEKYYVRVRTFKKVKGKKYVSSWSNVKTVTTK